MMLSRRLLSAPLALSLLATLSACGNKSHAQMTDAELKLEIGEAIFTTCAGCHGNAAQGRDYMYAPTLTGLEPGYVTRQLRNFREGRRGKLEDPHGFQMVGRATAIGDDSDVDAVVAFIDHLPNSTPVLLSSRSIPDGLEAQTQVCASCHGVDGGGNPDMGGPSLTTLDAPYIAKQLRKFRDGLRGYAEDDPQGQLMAASAQAIIDDADIDSLATYYGN